MFQRAKRMLLAAEAASPRPLDSGLDHALGSILLREQRPDAAIERFSRAIAKAPEKRDLLPPAGTHLSAAGRLRSGAARSAGRRGPGAGEPLEPGLARRGALFRRQDRGRPAGAVGISPPGSKPSLRTPGTPMFSTRFSSTHWRPTHWRKRARLWRWRWR